MSHPGLVKYRGLSEITPEPLYTENQHLKPQLPIVYSAYQWGWNPTEWHGPGVRGRHRIRKHIIHPLQNPESFNAPSIESLMKNHIRIK